MSESRLCNQCQKILSAGPDDNEAENDSYARKEHHVGSETFFQAVAQDCYICKWVWRDHRWSRMTGRRTHMHVDNTTYDWEKSEDQLIQSAWDMWQLNIICPGTTASRSSWNVFWGLESSIEGNFIYMFTFFCGTMYLSL